jgi:hypothetical protein
MNYNGKLTIFHYTHYYLCEVNNKSAYVMAIKLLIL